NRSPGQVATTPSDLRSAPSYKWQPDSLSSKGPSPCSPAWPQHRHICPTRSGPTPYICAACDPRCSRGHRATDGASQQRNSIHSPPIGVGDGKVRHSGAMLNGTPFLRPHVPVLARGHAGAAGRGQRGREGFPDGVCWRLIGKAPWAQVHLDTNTDPSGSKQLAKFGLALTRTTLGIPLSVRTNVGRHEAPEAQETSTPTASNNQGRFRHQAQSKLEKSKSGSRLQQGVGFTLTMSEYRRDMVAGHGNTAVAELR
ncbi:hypothetical protein BaRGS_00027642, partial [Batillaria attramentaria]